MCPLPSPRPGYALAIGGGSWGDAGVGVGREWKAMLSSGVTEGLWRVWGDGSGEKACVRTPVRLSSTHVKGTDEVVCL